MNNIRIVHEQYLHFFNYLIFSNLQTKDFLIPISLDRFTNFKNDKTKMRFSFLLYFSYHFLTFRNNSNHRVGQIDNLRAKEQFRGRIDESSKQLLILLRVLLLQLTTTTSTITIAKTSNFKAKRIVDKQIDG